MRSASTYEGSGEDSGLSRLVITDSFLRSTSPQPMSERFSVPLSMHLIQGLRLCHALAETRFTLCVSAADRRKFEHLQQYFDLRFEVGEAPPLYSVRISHQEPETRIGAVVRPLIFPHGVVGRCLSKWRDQRDYRVSFQGLVTRGRRATLKRWQAGTHSATIIDSRRGRNPRTKSWDDRYFDLLANSQFALCPNGDHVWTYRFFEAALCGAIPIVEDITPIYADFTYLRLSDDISDFDRSKDVVESNFERARSLLTVPREDLERAIETGLTA